METRLTCLQKKQTDKMLIIRLREKNWPPFLKTFSPFHQILVQTETIFFAQQLSYENIYYLELFG